MWTEGDMNMTSGEAITRSFLLGQRYFQSRFGKMANIGWLPDNFGHISQMPQILKLGGVIIFIFIVANHIRELSGGPELIILLFSVMRMIPIMVKSLLP